MKEKNCQAVKNKRVVENFHHPYFNVIALSAPQSGISGRLDG
jgi:hypothetical protein